MTTDTFPKVATATAQIGWHEVRINGVAKGSGMIAPDMATMLGFLCTDAAIPAGVLQTVLVRAVERSFNAITVDSDTSTSDTVMLCATGKAGNTAPCERRRPCPGGLSPEAGAVLPRSGAPNRARWGGRLQVRCDHGHRRGFRPGRPNASASPSPTRRW